MSARGPRIKVRCSARSGIQASCGCGTQVTGAFYPLDLESVADWAREHWLVEHATRRELLRIALLTVRGDEHFMLCNWREELVA